MTHRIRRPSRMALRCLPLIGLIALGACSGDELTRTFGLTRDAPDEFLVTTQPPLSMPPDLLTLPRPSPGERRPQDLTQQQQAQAALVPSTVLQAPASQQESAGQQALVAAAGPAAPRGIRNTVNEEAALDTPTRSFADRLMFWQAAPTPGTVVDPKREAERLRQNAALGQSPQAGDTPIIQRKRQGIFSSLF